VGGRVTPKHSYTMDKFILKDDLGDILESIAESAIEHSREVRVEIAFSAYVDVQTMTVRTSRNGGDYATLDRSEFRIVDKITDDYSIEDETIGVALKNLEALKAEEARREEENNNDNE
jgi:hypothetical protein